MKAHLTPKQALFCEFYALSGNGTRAAMQSGTKHYGSAKTLASRWLSKAYIQARVAEIRSKAFGDLRNQVSKQLHEPIMHAMDHGSHLKRARRAIALMNRLGVYQHYQQTTKEIAELEQRLGVPFEVLVAAQLYGEELLKGHVG
jgi:phage terminase small subunit